MNYGRYEIIKEVGRGSMGVVYLARDPHIDRLIAVKVMRRDRMENETFVKRFMKEAKVIGRLSHPQVVTIYDVGEEQGEIYIAMEFLEGTPLSEVIKGTPLKPDRILELGIQIAETLDYAHGKGVIHRDIKPSNIVIEPDGRAKITDFGIARIEDTSATLQTQTGEIMGTPAYMSPEQVLGNQVDGRSDIFSLGVVLYELSTGRRPFGGDGKTLATVFNDIIAITPQEPHAKADAIPRDLSGVIMKALNKEPAERFQTGKEMAAALKGCFEKPAPQPESVPVLNSDFKGNYPNLAVLIIIVVMLAVIAGAGYYFYQSRQTVPPPRPSQAKKAPSPPDIVKNKIPQQEVVPPPLLPLKPQPERPATEKPVKDQPVSPPKRDQKREERKEGKAAPPPEKTAPLPKFSTLVLRTAPPGASIQIDGKSRGSTPLSLRLPKGEHRIRATLAGYEKLEKQLVMGEAKTYSLTLSLKTMAGSDEWVVKPLVDRPAE